jgi:hypothetical protein
VPEVPDGSLEFVDSVDVRTTAFFAEPINPDDNAIPKVTGPPDEELIAQMLTEHGHNAD